MGSSINDVSSKGEGGGIKNVGMYLLKRQQRGRERGRKIRNMVRRRYGWPLAGNWSLKTKLSSDCAVWEVCILLAVLSFSVIKKGCIMYIGYVILDTFIFFLSCHFVRLLRIAKRSHYSDFCLSMTQDSSELA